MQHDGSEEDPQCTPSEILRNVTDVQRALVSSQESPDFHQQRCQSSPETRSTLFPARKLRTFQSIGFRVWVVPWRRGRGRGRTLRVPPACSSLSTRVHFKKLVFIARTTAQDAFLDRYSSTGATRARHLMPLGTRRISTTQEEGSSSTVYRSVYNQLPCARRFRSHERAAVPFSWEYLRILSKKSGNNNARFRGVLEIYFPTVQ